MPETKQTAWMEPNKPWGEKVAGYGPEQSDAKLIAEAELAGAPPGIAMMESRFCNDVPPL